jgi:hypothetical protein
MGKHARPLGTDAGCIVWGRKSGIVGNEAFAVDPFGRGTDADVLRTSFVPWDSTVSDGAATVTFVAPGRRSDRQNPVRVL